MRRGLPDLFFTCLGPAWAWPRRRAACSGPAPRRTPHTARPELPSPPRLPALSGPPPRPASRRSLPHYADELPIYNTHRFHLHCSSGLQRLSLPPPWLFFSSFPSATAYPTMRAKWRKKRVRRLKRKRRKVRARSK
ncbi:hypothetical protein PICMEDRAFT_108797 [Pichia membranifaciens NRRL Y-2026]|uniref:60S ribosomal protein L41 n=1 Tax=Pichia membranifaciens NRRL Y-2026 TaxID=763406 RepID=A0A1E3NM48_9ASCO|nr:hypothetical protein PICMEDRAFT_108797 [Pichia membranifaciens NRRL Y-2026]ODQ47214.1 hypothetical protein PICMEDRAFT_108797 [Pichia membranifaciens NRRL Y-2026]